jgi:hypothetical protein
MHRRPALAFVVALGLLAPACGSGGGNPLFTVVSASDGAVDGFVTNPTFVDTTHRIAVGDTDAGFMNVARGFVHFPLAGIPAGATILVADLRLFQSAVFGTPYGTHGPLVVDHVDTGGMLDGADFAAPALLAHAGTLSDDTAIAYKTLNVTAQVQDDLTAGRTHSDFRLRFTLDSDADAVDDYVEFNDGEDSAANGMLPLLVILYQRP